MFEARLVQGSLLKKVRGEEGHTCLGPKGLGACARPQLE